MFLRRLADILLKGEGAVYQTKMFSIMYMMMRGGCGSLPDLAGV